MGIKYLVGDATRPVWPGHKFIIHISNDAGGWGHGFVLSVSKRWSGPESVYRRQSKSGLQLGTVQVINVESDITVVNMIAQHGYGNRNSTPPIRYDALQSCLEKVTMMCNGNGSSVHAPRIGTGLSWGNWNQIQKIIEDTLCSNGVEVFIYDLPVY